MDLAVYDLKMHKGRFLATIIGVGLLITVVLAMNGIDRGNVQEGLAVVLATNPDLWVVERARGGPINEQSTLPEFYHYSVRAIPGVAQASPFIFYTVERRIGGQSRHFSIIGYDVFGGLGGPQQIYAGRGIQQAHYEMVAHPKLGVRLGDRVPLGLHTYTVVGLTREAVSPEGEALVYLSLPDAQEILYQKDNEEVRNQRQRWWRTLTRSGALAPLEAEKLARQPADTHFINAILVRLRPGVDRVAVARHIEDWLYFSVYSTPEEVQLILKGRLAGITRQILLFRALLLIVSVVIISLVIYTFTIDKIRSIAVMKLIGAPNRTIIRLVMEQSLLITVGAFLFGLILIQNTYQLFPKTVLRLPGDDIITFIATLVGGVIASALGLWQALKTEPALALGGQ
ncbi:MAG: ABC transporter permease [Desulfobaccales bacterium]